MKKVTLRTLLRTSSFVQCNYLLDQNIAIIIEVVFYKQSHQGCDKK